MVYALYPTRVSAQAPETGAGNLPQCSAIREIIYSAHVKQFENLIQNQIKGSHRYQVRGAWRFETTQYTSLVDWPGATKSYIDHSEEKTDSSHKLIRQYVAEFGGLQTQEQARYWFETLNRQIAECRLPLNDSDIVVLRPIPMEKIKGDLPVAAIDARLYPVTVKKATAAQPGQEVVIMTAYEKNGRLYTAYMIVEYRLQQEEWP